jgi:hypothetical protein
MDSESADWGFSSWKCFRLIKPPARAVEKAVVCYGGDVSRVTDICRGRILFDNVADLAACIDLLWSDSRVRIVWLQNGLSPFVHPREGGCFRVSAA